MWGALIAAIVSIAATAINAGVQSNENDENRAEAQGIANQNRQDTMKQQAVENKLNRNSLNLQNQKLAHDTNMTNATIKQKDIEVKDQINTANQESLTQSANKVLGTENTNDSWLFKRSLLNRIK